MDRNPRIGLGRLRLPLAIALAAGLVGSIFAGGASAGAEHTITMEREGSKVFFSPKSVEIVPGEGLFVVNNTNPSRVGPHTFSLVKKRVRPDTRQERRKCFNKGHICRKIAKWHDIDLDTGQVGQQVVDRGLQGWDRMGDKDKVGDSWYTETRGEGFEAPTLAADTTLYFMCAIHPNMKGKLVMGPEL